MRTSTYPKGGKSAKLLKGYFPYTNRENIRNNVGRQDAYFTQGAKYVRQELIFLSGRCRDMGENGRSVCP